MGVFNSHNALCGCMFADNATDGVEDLSLHETSKGEDEKEKNGILMQMI